MVEYLLLSRRICRCWDGRQSFTFHHRVHAFLSSLVDHPGGHTCAGSAGSVEDDTRRTTIGATGSPLARSRAEQPVGREVAMSS